VRAASLRRGVVQRQRRRRPLARGAFLRNGVRRDAPAGDVDGDAVLGARSGKRRARRGGGVRRRGGSPRGAQNSLPLL